jgi:hypothetical protein
VEDSHTGTAAARTKQKRQICRHRFSDQISIERNDSKLLLELDQLNVIISHRNGPTKPFNMIY